MMDEIDVVSAAEVEVQDFKITNAVDVDELKQEILSPLRETQSDPEDMVHGDIKIEDSVDLEFFESPELETAPSISYDDDAASPIFEPSVASVSSIESEPSSPSTTTSSPKTKRRKMQTTADKKNKNPLKRIELLERHSVEQARLLTQMSNSIKSIQRSMRDLKDNEAQLLKLEEERNKREEEKYLMDLKMKKIELSIQIKKLQLQIAPTK